MDPPCDMLALTFDESVAAFKRHFGRGRFHAAAAFRALYREFNLSFWEAEEFRSTAGLAQAVARGTVAAPGEIVDEGAVDGVVKFITRLADGEEIESVLLPMKTHRTLCVSSQVGCRMGCRFCETAKMGLRRQLSVAEIVGQVFNARRRYGENIRNVVFMGMGEPFDNFDTVVQAIRVLNDQRGLDIALKFITVSTVGRVDGIRRLAALGMPLLKLAVSLNAARDDLRSHLMPVNRSVPLAALQRALVEYPMRSDYTLMVGYVLIPGVNDTPEDAVALADFVAPLPVKVNLIAFNPGTSAPYRAPDDDEITAFRNRLIAARVQVQPRPPRGRDLMAACGQLGALRRPDRFAGTLNDNRS
ncbi:MAG: 23S rRNA (adenine(2503)-C(2))-methyltransferase RlmN [Pseudomonadota bacterium]